MTERTDELANEVAAKVVTSGTRRASSRQKAFDAGNSSPLVTTVTSTSPLLWPTRTTAWRTKPAPVSSL